MNKAAGEKDHSATQAIEEVNNTNADGIDGSGRERMPKWKCEYVTHGRSRGEDKGAVSFSLFCGQFYTGILIWFAYFLHILL
jgi:hypothetical protein